MDLSKYLNFEDFCNKTGMTSKEALDFLKEELEKREIE
jgi:hypothetical protein